MDANSDTFQNCTKKLDFPKKKPKTSPIKTCYLGLGSNIGSAEENIHTAIELISKLANVTLERAASNYLTKAWGNTDQADFVNTVITISTSLKPKMLLRELKNIEKDMGRVTAEKWGPRLIDIDILLYANNVVNQPQLTIPHPHLTERSFVLVPLFELNPDLVIPKVGKIAKFINNEQSKTEVKKIK